MIYLVRHGQTDWNLDERLQGQTDIPLNENGRKQAELISEDVLKLKIKHIFSSDLSRARETAEIINKKIGVGITFDKRLRECGFGNFEGKSMISDEEWELFHANPVKYSGETSADLFNRVKTFFDDLTAENIDDAVVVAHGIILRMMLYHADNEGNFNHVDWHNYLRSSLAKPIPNALVIKWQRTKRIGP